MVYVGHCQPAQYRRNARRFEADPDNIECNHCRTARIPPALSQIRALRPCAGEDDRHADLSVIFQIVVHSPREPFFSTQEDLIGMPLEQPLRRQSIRINEIC